MSLDFQKTTYHRIRGKPDTRNRTSYSHMNQWHELTPNTLAASSRRSPAYPPESTLQFGSCGPPHLLYYQSGGHDDAHKAYLSLQQSGEAGSWPLSGPPMLRNGRGGASWRHVKDVLQARGSRTVFVDGTPRLEDTSRVMHREVPGCNLLQPSALTPCPAPKHGLAASDHHKRKQLPADTWHGLQALKGTEKANWYLMR